MTARLSIRMPARQGERFTDAAADSVIGKPVRVTMPVGSGFEHAIGDGRVIAAAVVDDGDALWITIEGDA